MGGEGDHVRVTNRAWNGSRCHQPGDMRDICQQGSAHRVGNGAEALPVGHPRIGGVSGDDDLGLMLYGQRFHRIVIDALGLRVDVVVYDLVELARTVDRRAVRQVTAVQQVHAQDDIARVEQRGIHGIIGRGPRQRLDVDKQPLGRVGRGRKDLSAAPPCQGFTASAYSTPL